VGSDHEANEPKDGQQPDAKSTAARLKDLLVEALDRPEADRRAFLEGACGDDRALFDEAESLLRAAEASGFLKSPTASFVADLPPSESAGGTIGPYKLLQQIGEGGFGAVFMAEQTEPIRRRVALKVIKLGMDTRQVVARFEQERQALAVMDHPNIAKVFDAGATASGRPYFVMELVKGQPITEYCDRQGLSVPERLELFSQVCHAVQHAHTKGVIHRDIKPRNVLVSTHDGKPLVKVIDFGIAKATDQRMTEKTLFTEHQAMIGTPEYMSPEQAEGSLDIDTRTDVYSLGVLLYELLTGATPFDGKSLREAGYGEICRIIREVDPPRPSVRVSTNAQAAWAKPAATNAESPSAERVAHLRKTDAAKLFGILKGDLDWVVMKALEKDRARRYATPTTLAEDVARYLAGDAVTAVPPSRWYRVRKFVRRNRTGVVAGVTVTIAVAAVVLAQGSKQASANRARLSEQAQQRIATELQIEAYARAVLKAVRAAADGLWDDANKALVACPESLRAIEWALAKAEVNEVPRSEITSWGNSYFDPSGEYLADVGGSTVRLSRLSDGQTIFQKSIPLGDNSEPRRWNLAGRALALAAGDRGFVWRVSDGTDLYMSPDTSAHPSHEKEELRNRTFELSKDGGLLLDGLNGRVINVVDLTTGTIIRDFGNDELLAVSGAIWPDSRTVSVIFSDGKIVEWKRGESESKTVSRIRPSGAVPPESGLVAQFSPTCESLVLRLGKRSRIVDVRSGVPYPGEYSYVLGYINELRVVAIGADGVPGLFGIDGHLVAALRTRKGAGGLSVLGSDPAISASDFPTSLISGRSPALARPKEWMGGWFLDESPGPYDFWNNEIAGSALDSRRPTDGAVDQYIAAVTMIVYDSTSRTLLTLHPDALLTFDPMRIDRFPVSGVLPNILLGAGSADGERLVAINHDSLQVIDADGLHERLRIAHDGVNTRAVALSAPGDLLALLSASGELWLRSPLDGSVIARGQAPAEFASASPRCAVGNDGSIAVTNGRGDVVLFTRSGSALTESARTSLSGGAVTAVVAVPARKEFLVGMKDGSAHVVDESSLTVRVTLPSNGHSIGAMTPSFDGLRYFTASDDGSIRIWHAETGKELLTLNEERITAAPTAIFIEPNNERLVVGYANGAERIWDAVTWAERVRRRGKPEWPNTEPKLVPAESATATNNER
jgi:serine/threonine protein kinase/WD40 repeat protein